VKLQLQVDIRSRVLLSCRESSRNQFCLLPIAYCLLLAAYFLLPAAASEPERLSVYAPQARYNVPVVELDGRTYVDIFELLRPLAPPELKAEGKRWKLRIQDPRVRGRIAEAEFEPGVTVAKVRGKTVPLFAPARMENQRLLVPLHGIGAVLIPFLENDFVFHENALRMFIGGTPEPLSSELRKGEPSTLELHFPAAVSPSISSDGNSLKLSFTRDPVVSFTESEAISDKLFHSSSFVEKNGTATLTINGAAPLLARFANGGKTIVVTAAPAPPPVTASNSVPAAPQSASELGQPVAVEPPVTVEPPVAIGPPVATEIPQTTNVAATGSVSGPQPGRPFIQPTFLVVIDPAHGGTDTGARIAPNLLEKDITLSLARKLRQELQSRHIAVELLRDGDSDVTLDQRAIATNLARPAVFVSLHSEPGSVMRIYTPALPIVSPPQLERGSFLPWQTAQGAFANDSAALAAASVGFMQKRNIAAQVQPAFLQPLGSIAAPAFAVEAPADHNGLRIPEDQIANALADAVAARKQNAGSSR
jgi:N-acetylmuramoyl-L-alanine amidase